jgi:hypothetical protein
VKGAATELATVVIARVARPEAHAAQLLYAAPKSKLSCPVGSRARGSGTVRMPRCERIFLTAKGSVSLAMTRIFLSHFGQRSASKPKERSSHLQ